MAVAPTAPGHRSRHSRRSRLIRLFSAGLAVLAGIAIAGYVRDLSRQRPSRLVESLQARQITIDRFVRAERAAAPGMFDQRLLNNNRRALAQSFPDATFSDVSLVGVSDGDGWMRALLGYQGLLTIQGESVATHGQIAIYYHPGGMAVVGAACTAEASECKKLDAVLSEAERNLRARLGAADLERVLPESAQCTTESVPVPDSDRQSQVRACVYAPGMQLSFTRFDAAATIESLVAERAAVR